MLFEVIIIKKDTKHGHTIFWFSVEIKGWIKRTSCIQYLSKCDVWPLRVCDCMSANGLHMVHYCMDLYACLPTSKGPLLRIRKLLNVCCSDLCMAMCVCLWRDYLACCLLQHLCMCVCVCARLCVSVSHPRVKHLSVVRLSPNSCEQRQAARV